MTTWPSPEALAEATPADAIRMWANLGYPRRAVRLHQSAQVIADRYNNQVPQTFEQLIGLPGVGEYTANAILAFAFDQPTLVVDINVRRVISRAWLGQAHPANSLSAVERAFAQSLIPKNQKRAPLWAAASMELGALVCTAKNPQCNECPIRKTCLWFTSGRPNNANRPRTQAKYEGSDRQERGRILRELRSSDVALSIKQLRKSAKNEQQFDRALQSLIKEELIIHVPRSKVSLPES